LLIKSAIGRTKHYGCLGKLDVVMLYLKVASTIYSCKAYRVIILFFIICLLKAIQPTLENIMLATS
jgi:hypothetical protein